MEARSGGVADRPLSALRELWDDGLRLFANIPFGVSLLAFWALLTLIGVVIEQGKDPSFYAGAYPPPVARLIARLDLGNIYHSAAYIGVLGLILCSMTAATSASAWPTMNSFLAWPALRASFGSLSAPKIRIATPATAISSMGVNMGGSPV